MNINKIEGINVLSLFDGISCAKLALERAGIKINKYYSSEIDKSALKIQAYHHGDDPNFIQLGDVKNVNGFELSDEIDLVVFGSPCTNLSSINPIDRRGLEGSESILFYEALRILKEIYVFQPYHKKLYFLMENVASMKAIDRDKITEELAEIFEDELQLIKIDSALITPAHRRRLYWTNIPNVSSPHPTPIEYSDVLENGFVDRQKANVLLSGNVTLSNGIFRHYKMNIGNIIFKDEDFAKLPTEEKLKRYPDILKKSGYVGKSGSATDELAFHNNCYRLPSIREYSRMMTIPENYVQDVPNVARTQKHKAIGLAYSVDVVAHLLRGLGNWGTVKK
ncbi:DNA cytosine methyltransferase [Flavobacterium sp.]|uniref:DNA cytosine methyltransferase n=1 Tax=Flavobacterium sp. TaxID=239 RepID=UPI0026398437|nr:DNA cytosine methyltransferase [Flavobacterium sp.]